MLHVVAIHCQKYTMDDTKIALSRAIWLFDTFAPSSISKKVLAELNSGKSPAELEKVPLFINTMSDWNDYPMANAHETNDKCFSILSKPTLSGHNMIKSSLLNFMLMIHVLHGTASETDFGLKSKFLIRYSIPN